MRTTTAANWTEAAAPGIRTTYPNSIMRAMRYACQAVDIDIERTGTVSVKSVEAVRNALALIRRHDHATSAMHPDAWTPEFLETLPAEAQA
jgi:ribosome biogenesis protein Tsr3